jgi:DNA-binding CsgD family transcriptional regulator
VSRSPDVLDTIELLYRAAGEPELWPLALHRLSRACGGMGTAMIRITPGDPAGLVLSSDLQPFQAEYERDWATRDSRVARIFSRGLKGGVCAEPDLFTPEELKRDPLRQEFCRGQGMGSFAAQLVSPMPGLVVAFSVGRPLSWGEFEGAELDTLALLGRHAARALVVSSRLARADAAERGAEAALARLDCAAMLVEGDMRVTCANEAAARLRGEIAIRDGRLRIVRSAHAAAARLIRAAVDETSEALGPVAVPRAGGSKPLLLQAVPIPLGSALFDPRGAGLALVLVVDPEGADTRSVDRELRLLGLTRAEARLAALLGTGLSRGQAAEALDISANTVDDTIKHVYAKLGLSRQADLVRLVQRLKSLLSPAPPAL